MIFTMLLIATQRIVAYVLGRVCFFNNGSIFCAVKIAAKQSAIHNTMLKPVAISSAALDHSPMVTPSCPSTKDHSSICFGDCAKSRALSAGITNNAPINNEPTARNASTVNQAKSRINTKRCHAAFTPALMAISGSIAS